MQCDLTRCSKHQSINVPSVFLMSMSSSRYFCLRYFVLVAWASRDNSSKRRTRRSASTSFRSCLVVVADDVCCRSLRLSIGDVSPLSCGSDGDGSLRSGESCEPRRTRVRVRVLGVRWLWLRLTGFWRLAIRSIVRVRTSRDVGGPADEETTAERTADSQTRKRYALAADERS